LSKVWLCPSPGNLIVFDLKPQKQTPLQCEYIDGMVGLVDTTLLIVHGLQTLWLYLFYAGRVTVWAFLVIVAWLEIIEKGATKSQTQVQSRRWPQHMHIPRMESGVSDVDLRDVQGEGDSLEECWPLSEEDEDSLRQLSANGRRGEQYGEHCISSANVAPVRQHVVSSPRPTVQKARHDAGERGLIKAAGSTADDAHVLAYTTMGGNTDLVKEPERETVRRDPSTGQKVKEKKPFLTRKVEKWFIAPYTQKYERAGYMIYKGFNKVGHQIEISVNRLATDLDGAIRDAGVNAVREVEGVLQRWIKFCGLVVLLSIILLPLPAFNVTLSIAH
jgi:hypothetical protein